MYFGHSGKKRLINSHQKMAGIIGTLNKFEINGEEKFDIYYKMLENFFCSK